jgi:hypothetical protein
MRIQDLDRNALLDLTELFCRKEWADVAELLRTRKEDKVRELVKGTDHDERNRGHIEEIDYLLGLREKLVGQKNLVDISNANNIT